MSFKEAKRTFVTPEWSQDMFLVHVSSNFGQIKQNIKNEAHKFAGSTGTRHFEKCPINLAHFTS